MFPLHEPVHQGATFCAGTGASCTAVASTGITNCQIVWARGRGMACTAWGHNAECWLNLCVLDFTGAVLCVCRTSRCVA
jgi:hypothetical protein